MKKIIIIILLAGIFLLNINSCADKDMDYSYSIKDALKISAYIFDENGGEDYFVYNKVTKNYEYNLDESVYTLEQLKLNEAKTMAPMGVLGYNINLRFEFDGIIEVVSEDKDVQMLMDPNNCLKPLQVCYYDTPHGFEMELTLDGFIAFNPLGALQGTLWNGEGAEWMPNSLGREYYLTVNAYKFDNKQLPIIQAKLKLVQLEDKTSSGGNSQQASGCFSIELVSYKYSDIYKIMYDITDDD